MRSTLFFFLLLCTVSTASAFPGNGAAINGPLLFIENKGQVHDQHYTPRTDIQFQLHAAGMDVFVGDGAIHYQFAKTEGQPSAPTGGARQDEAAFTYYRLDVVLVGANKDAQMLTGQCQQYRERYYTAGTGNDGVTALAYDRITYKDVYPNIDWVLYTREGHLKHEFVVRAGGRVSDIKLRYDGATKLALNADGSVVATTPLGAVSEDAPMTYQTDGSRVQSHYKLENNVLTYEMAPYAGTLTIDPTIAWGTYYGGSVIEEALATTTDISGNVYLAAQVYSGSTGLATAGAHQVTSGGSYDALLVQFNSAGVRQWATYYGGTNSDDAQALTTDLAGNVYMTGNTTSSTAIATVGAHDELLGSSSSDAYLVKFDNSGARLWGTYYGGTGSELANGVTVDLNGDLYLCGQTSSSASIATTGAFDAALGGSPDAFLVKFSSGGTRIWGTYFGYSQDEGAGAVTTDAWGNVYLAGSTTSISGLATTSAHQTTYGGLRDAFLAKFDSTGARRWSTYYGGTGTEEAYAVATDIYGNVYIGGRAESSGSIASAGSHQSTIGSTSGVADGFLVKFDSVGVRQWGTYYGGTGNDRVQAVSVNGAANVYVAGRTASTTAIATAGTYQLALGGANDGFVAKFNSLGVRQWGTYYGGAADDFCYAMATIGSGAIYITGSTLSTSGISTAGSHQPVKSTTTDAFLAKLNDCLLPDAGVISGSSVVCISGSTTLTTTGTGGTWSSSSANATVTPGGGVVSGVSAGTTNITYTATNSCGSTFATRIVTVSAAPSVFGAGRVCVGFATTLTSSVGGGTWSSSAPATGSVSTGGVVSGIVVGTMVISYAIPGCTTTRTMTVDPLPLPIAGTFTICPGSTTTLSDATAGGTWASSNVAVGSINYATGVLTGTGAGTAVITYEHATTGCYVTAVVSVHPAPATISGPTTVCVGSTITLSDATGGGTWSTGSSTASIGSATGVVTGISAGTATFTYTLATGCYTTHTATVNPVPAPITGTLLLCAGATTTLSTTTTGGSWTSGSSGIASIGASTGFVSALSGGTANISYTIPTGCRAVATLTVNAIPATIGGSLIICVGGAATLTNTVTGGSWTSASPSIATIGSATGLVTGMATGTSVITYAMPAGCIRTAVVTVNPAMAAVGGTMSVCSGGTTTLTCTTPGGTWSSASTATATIGTGSGIATGAAAGTTTITYAVTPGCTSTATLTVNPMPGPIGGTANLCITSSTTLTNSASGGTWSSADIAIATIDGATGLATGVSSGTTTISYTLPAGCFVTRVFTVNPLPGPIVGPTEVCVGGSITLSCGPSGGTWATSGTSIGTITSTGTLTGVSEGTVFVTYILPTGCRRSDTVTVIALLDPGALTGPTEVCEGQTITLSASVPGGTWVSSTANASVAGGVVTGVAAGTTTISYVLTNPCGITVTTYEITIVPAANCPSGVAMASDQDDRLLLFPNPNDGTFTLELQAGRKEAIAVSVTDVLGREVQKFHAVTDEEKTVHIATPGVYFVQVSAAEGRYVKKVVVR